MRAASSVLRRTVPRARATTSSVRAFSAFWNHVEMGPKDPILGVTEAYNADTAPDKISVGVGAYRTDEGKPWVLPSVAEAEKRVIGMNMEYAPISGVPAFVTAATNLAYGADSDAVKNNKVAALQSLSGTGALRLAANYVSKFWSADGSKPKIYLPNPTWGNHFPIFKDAGLETAMYRYWNPETLGLNLDGMLEDLRNGERGVVLLHSCAHNPTGVDPNMDQWKEISKVCKEKGHFVIFDNAYQGFASGDTEKDVQSVHMFIKEGHNIALCQSFAKNFGLYGQRVGNFSILCQDSDEASRVSSQLKIIARAIYSNPPIQGARIVATILDDPALKSQWQSEIELMANRIMDMRALLKDKLTEAGSTRNWDHITNQIGMFSYTGLTPEQCDIMTNKHSVYLTRNGRISMAGVTTGNVTKLANAMHDATK